MSNVHSTLSGLFTDIASAIREKTGGVDGIVADAFPSAIRSISGGGDSALLWRNILYRSFVEIDDAESTQIGSCAFAGCTDLVSINIPNCTIVWGGAFEDCSGLESVYLPGCEVIWKSAFYCCSNLTTLSVPECTTVEYKAFAGCINLINASFPKCTFLEYGAFSGCKNLINANFPKCSELGDTSNAAGNDVGVFQDCVNLASINFPECVAINGSAFQDCSNLTYADFPKCETVGYYAFRSCTGLTSVSFPKCTSIDNAFTRCDNLTTIHLPECLSVRGAFIGCTNLASVNLPRCVNISMNTFSHCYNLSLLYLGASSVCTLYGSRVFLSTPFYGYSSYFSGHPRIYVPASLVSSYQAATNWTYFSSYFYALDQTITVHLINTDYEGLDMTIEAKSGMTWEEWVSSEHNVDGFTISDDDISIFLPVETGSDGTVLIEERFRLYNDETGTDKTLPGDIVDNEHYLFSTGEGVEAI